MAKQKEPKKKVRGGFTLLQVDVYADTPAMMQRYIEKNGGTKASVTRLALDGLLKPEYEIDKI